MALLATLIVSTFGAPLLAAPLTWTINQSASSVTVNIPQQNITVGTTTLPARMVNQSSSGTGSGSSWTSGNSAHLSGTIATNYADGSSIQFLTGQSHINGVLSTVNYFPNPANFVQNPSLPTGEGSFTGTRGGSGPAVFGGVAQLNILFGFSDAGPLVFPSYELDVASGVLPISGTSFNATGTSLGTELATIALDVTNSLVSSQLGYSGLYTSFSTADFANTLSGGTITSGPGLLRTLTLPINVQFQIVSGSLTLNGSETGTLVATAMVPEPGSFALLVAGVSLAGLFFVRRRRPAGIMAATLLLALAADNARAGTMTSTISLGPPNTGTFSGTLTGQPGSSLYLGTVSGNFRQYLGSILGHPQYANFGISAQNQSTGLSIGTSTISTNSSSGTANLQYDNLAPGTPEILNSISANLSDGASSPISINTSGSISVSFGSLGSFPLTMQLQNGTISGITFTSTAGTSDNPNYIIPGNYTAVLNGHVEGFIGLPLGLGTLDIGNLFTLPGTPIVFPGVLPGTTTLSDIGVGSFPHDMLADFAVALSNVSLPFTFTAPLNVSYTGSLGTTQSGITSLTIGSFNGNPSLLTAHLALSNLSYDLSGKSAATLVPEPSALVLGSMAIVALAVLVARHAKLTKRLQPSPAVC